MTTSLSGIADLDVAVVDLDLLWRVEKMNLIKGPYVREFSAIEEAAAALTEGRPGLVVLGPSFARSRLSEIDELREARPELSIVWVSDDAGADTDVDTDVDTDTIVQLDEPPELEAIDDAGDAEEDDANLEEFYELELAEEAEELVPPLSGRGAPVPTFKVLPEMVADDAFAAEVAALVPVSAIERAMSVREASPLAASEASEPRGFPLDVIVVTSAKGGEGVTTVATNLAAGLARRSSGPVALLDADANFGDIDLLLGLPRTELGSLGSWVLDDTAVDRLIVEHEPTGVLVVHPPVARHGRSRELPPEALLDLLDALATRADVLVIDSPLEVVQRAGLDRLATVVLLVTTPRMASMKNALVAAKALGLAGNVRIVVNEVGRMKDETDRAQIERALSTRVVALLPYDAKLDRSGVTMHPMVLADRRSDYARVNQTLIGFVREGN